MNKGFRALIIATIVMVFMCGFGIISYADDTVILEGIYADNIPLGGMSHDQAVDAINTCVEELRGRFITLYTVNDEEITINPSEVGFSWNNPVIVDQAEALGHSGNIVQRYKSKKDLNYTNQIFNIEYTVDENLVRQILDERCAIYNQQASEGLLSRVDGHFVINEGQTGAELDVEASVADLSDFLCNTWTGENSAFQLTISMDDPAGSYEKLALVQDVLGAFHTSFKSSNANRSANVRNGARLINGSLIYPGEEYSFYDHIKPFTTANGYEIGSAYAAGKVVDSIGGGICQVSSTLYNAVLYAELEVTARRNHAMIVGYVDPARDATIAESSGIDFKFRNNTDAPIYLEAICDDNKELYITLYGHETRSADRVVEYESEILSKTVPDTENIYTDSSQPVGFIETQGAHTGYKANLWKKVTVNGETTKELVNTSNYNATPRYATVGMATDDPTIAAIMNDAVASGSIDTVKAAIGQCKAIMSQGGVDPAAAMAAYEAALEQQSAQQSEQQPPAEEQPDEEVVDDQV